MSITCKFLCRVSEARSTPKLRVVQIGQHLGKSTELGTWSKGGERRKGQPFVPLPKGCRSVVVPCYSGQALGVGKLIAAGQNKKVE